MLFRVTNMRLYTVIECILITINIALAMSPQLSVEEQPKLVRLHLGIMCFFIVWTGLRMISNGIFNLASDKLCIFDMVTTTVFLVLDGLIKVEVCIIKSPYARLFPLKALGLLRYLNDWRMSIHLRIFLKSVIMFLPYASPFLVIFTSYVLIVNLLALQAFNRKAYTFPFHESSVDSYVLYLPTTIKLFFGNGWSSTMYGCAKEYGMAVSVYFIALAVVSKFVVENCFISIFVFIYSENYWQYIREDSSKIVLGFEKPAKKKRTFINKSIFLGNRTKKDNKETPKEETHEEEIKNKISFSDHKSLSVTSREAEVFLKFANAVKFTKNVRLRKRQSISLNLFSKKEVSQPRESVPMKHRKDALRKATTAKTPNPLPLARIKEESYDENEERPRPVLAEAGSMRSRKESNSSRFRSQAITFSPKNTVSPASLRFTNSEAAPVGSLDLLKETTNGSDLNMPFRAAVSKLKMIKTANLFKEIVTNKSYNKFMGYFKSKLFFQVSVFFSGMAVVAVSITTKRTVCANSNQRWAAMMLFWFCNSYFTIEYFSLVHESHPGLHHSAHQEAVYQVVRKCTKYHA